MAGVSRGEPSGIRTLTTSELGLSGGLGFTWGEAPGAQRSIGTARNKRVRTKRHMEAGIDLLDGNYACCRRARAWVLRYKPDARNTKLVAVSLLFTRWAAANLFCFFAVDAGSPENFELKTNN